MRKKMYWGIGTLIDATGLIQHQFMEHYHTDHFPVVSPMGTYCFNED